MSDSTFNALLIHTCDISRRTLDTSDLDEWGASAETFTLISEDEECRFQQKSEDVEFTRRGEKLYTRILFFMKPTANILEDDIIEFESKKYRVIAVEDVSDDTTTHHKEVYLINLENSR